ncbi:hypothetical protein [Vibrio breoganii]|uniref:hypothetical protein n=1 Tax=Vibrio breoganii TaxID=553239 RepID=UPI00030FD779|nr:hypothetical protein [Vibrio breoganii]OED94251.1 hypothetical protein A1QG_05775 [Vibrio breoganii ZF-29]
MKFNKEDECRAVAPCCRVFKVASKVLLVLSATSLVACDSDSIVQEKSPQICLQAENRYIDGSTGFSSVVMSEFGGIRDIGYTHNGAFVSHSECAPAKTTITGTSTLYEWFEYGDAIEEDGVISLEFAYVNNRIQIKAIRKKSPGTPDVEFSERSIDYDSQATVNKRVWNSEFPSLVVISQDKFNGTDEIFSVGEIGSARKEQRWNDNTLQWDCSYITLTDNKLVPGCIDEVANDLTYLGVEVDLLSYFNTLATVSIDYETEPEKIDRLFDVYGD